MSASAGAPDLIVALEVVVRHGQTVEHRRAVHSLHGRSVRLVETVGGEERRRTVDIGAWGTWLAGICTALAVPEDGPPRSHTGLLLPWDVVVGTGAALAAGRQDLYAELVGRLEPPAREELGRLHRLTRGRLRAVATMPERHRVGWVAWVLLVDGWRALTPCTSTEPSTGPGHVRAMLRLDPRQPGDLAHDVARWMAGATR